MRTIDRTFWDVQYNIFAIPSTDGFKFVLKLFGQRVECASIDDADTFAQEVIQATF